MPWFFGLRRSASVAGSGNPTLVFRTAVGLLHQAFVTIVDRPEVIRSNAPGPWRRAALARLSVVTDRGRILVIGCSVMVFRDSMVPDDSSVHARNTNEWKRADPLLLREVPSQCCRIWRTHPTTHDHCTPLLAAADQPSVRRNGLPAGARSEEVGEPCSASSMPIGKRRRDVLAVLKPCVLIAKSNWRALRGAKPVRIPLSNSRRSFFVTCSWRPVPVPALRSVWSA